MKIFNVRIMTTLRSSMQIPANLKAVIKLLTLFIAFSAATSIAPQKASAQGSISFQVFYDDLSPYGYWVNNSDYGYVWVPRVSHGFIPYGTNGHWIFTPSGWTWVSNYSWGWAPFHYGRWFYDSYYGWVWVPDYEWAPAWVIWRRGEGYYGWAPIGPGISIEVAYSSGYNLPYDRWRFVRERDFGRTNIYNYYVSSSNYTTIINKSTVINNFQVDHSRNVRYNAGPDRTEVERHVGKQFTPVAIKEIGRPGQNLSRGELQIYRPQVQKNVSADRRPAPSKVMDWKGNQPPARQQPVQQQRNDRPARQQPVQQQRNDRPARQQPVQRQRNDRPARQQPVQQQRNDKPARQQPVQQQRNNQPVKQQPVQQQRNDRQARPQPDNQKPSQSPKKNPPKKEND